MLVGVAGFEPATPSSRTLGIQPQILILLSFLSRFATNNPVLFVLDGLIHCNCVAVFDRCSHRP